MCDIADRAPKRLTLRHHVSRSSFVAPAGGSAPTRIGLDFVFDSPCHLAPCSLLVCEVAKCCGQVAVGVALQFLFPFVILSSLVVSVCCQLLGLHCRLHPAVLISWGSLGRNFNELPQAECCELRLSACACAVCGWLGGRRKSKLQLRTSGVQLGEHEIAGKHHPGPTC